MSDYSRYSRQLGVIGKSGQDSLAKANILCVGAGGLGTLVSSYLVAMGIGVITIADGDIIELSNLSRQICYNEANLGQNKAIIMGRYLQQLNSNCSINIHDSFLTQDNAQELISKADYIVDCSDNFKTRYLLSDICAINDKSLISAAVNGFMGQVMVFSHQCCYRCLFPDVNSSNSCIEGDVIGPAVGIIASIEANEVFKLITGIDTSSHLIQVDSLANTLKRFNITSDTACINNHADIVSDKAVVSYLAFKQALKLAADKVIQIVDIRSTVGSNPLTLDVIKINHNNISDLVKFTPKNQAIAVICNYGFRSRFIALRLVALGYTEVYFSDTKA